MLKNILAQCGLNETEQKIFLFLLDYGPSIASTISKKTGIKRPTVYAGLEALGDIGIVIKQKKNTVNYFATIPLDTIPKVFEYNAKNKFEDVIAASKVLESQMKSRKEKEGFLFENITLESIEAVYAQLESVLLGGNFSAIFNPQRTLVNPVQTQLVVNFLNKTAETKPFIREIAVAGPKTEWYRKRIKNSNHELKVLPENFNFSSDLILLDGEVFLLDYSPKNEVSIKIKNKSHYLSMTALFEYLWKTI